MTRWMWLRAEAVRVCARLRGRDGTLSVEGRFVRMQSPKEVLLAVELHRAGIAWTYAPRIGPVRVADFRLGDGTLIEVWSGRGEVRKSALPECAIMSSKTRRGIRTWINKTLRDCSTK